MTAAHVKDFELLMSDETPLSWLQRGHAGSLTLHTFLDNLQERVEYLENVASKR